MLRRALVVVAVVVLASNLARAAEFGTADEAKAMLDKVVAAVKSDKAKALEAFNDRTDGFKGRDLYPFCANAVDGIIVAHSFLKGTQLRNIVDENDFALGEELMNAADTEGKIGEVAYLWMPPGGDSPVRRVSYVTKIGDLVCGVGYYQ